MRVLPLGLPIVVEGGPGKDAVATGGKTPFATATLARLAADTGVLSIGNIGGKAARLGAALRAGLPVLPGWVVPVGVGKSAMGAGVEAVRANGAGAGGGGVPGGGGGGVGGGGGESGGGGGGGGGLGEGGGGRGGSPCW